tara:strand:+ start:287 stop:508 length:222 start_codon:yes stop_codon:yes gene_type:complete
MVAIGLSNDAIIATSIVPPPSPKVAETKEVKKLTKHRLIKAQLESSGTLQIISDIVSIKSDANLRMQNRNFCL